MRLARDLDADTVRYQGNWIPHALRDATEDGVFFVGDSAGHCLPLTAEGIRTALYFGLACGRELRGGARRRADPRAQALARYHAFSASHAGRSTGCCGSSGWSRGSRRGCSAARCARCERKRFVDWSFGHYLNVAHPDFVARAPSRRAPRRSPQRASASRRDRAVANAQLPPAVGARGARPGSCRRGGSDASRRCVPTRPGGRRRRTRRRRRSSRAGRCRVRPVNATAACPRRERGAGTRRVGPRRAAGTTLSALLHSSWR